MATKTETVFYSVRSCGCEHYRTDSEADAIETAKAYDTDTEAEVWMHVTSGDYSSRTRVWPTPSPTYT